MFYFLLLTDKQINGCSLDQQEDRERLEVEVKPVEPAITEEHMSCVTGMVYVQGTGLQIFFFFFFFFNLKFLFFFKCFFVFNMGTSLAFTDDLSFVINMTFLTNSTKGFVRSLRPQLSFLPHVSARWSNYIHKIGTISK